MKQPYLKHKRSKKWIIFVGIVSVIILGGFLLRDEAIKWIMRPTDSTLEQGVQRSDNSESIEIIAENLDIPWEVLELPSGDLLVTERSGALVRIGDNEQSIPISGVSHFGEGGLLGMALHPNFAQNRLLYLYFTTNNDGKVTNRVERYVYKNDNLSQRLVILADIPGANYHDGGRIAFGPDGHLYITTGDAGDEMQAQDTSSLAGKILRINDDGSIPEDNPFGNPVYAYGIRNAQGIAWDDQNRLWAIDHGRSGLESGYDELNVIERGKNYGWPIIEGDETREGMQSPVVHSGANETWAPAGLAFFEGSLFFTGLRGESLYQAIINSDDTVSLKAHFRGDYGRLRAVSLGSDKKLLISTSNQDGRGSTNEGDDKIIRLQLLVFNK